MSGSSNTVFKYYFNDFLVGRLVEGLIHNINSPLQIASMNLELLNMFKKSPPPFPDQIWERIKQIKDSIERIQHITDIMVKRKEFGEAGTTAVILEEIVKNELEFWNADLFFKHNINKEIKLGETSNVVLVDAFLLIDLIDAAIALQISMLKFFREQGLNFAVRKKEDGQTIILTFERSGPSYEASTSGILCPDEEDQEFFRLCNDVMFEAASRLDSKIEVKGPSITLILSKARRS